MRCPTLEELPPPPPGRAGWPWTEASSSLDPVMPDGRPWPRISIVTPSFNQGAFLEETIRSVLLQGYPDLEYVIMDGGSTDGSVEVIRRYEPWLTSWRTGPDGGQSDAINQGFARTTGNVLAWLNSDDLYFPDAFGTIARKMTATDCDIFIGAMDKVEVEGDRVEFVRRSSPRRGMKAHALPILRDRPVEEFHFIQPPMFWRRWVWEKAGGLDERYHYVMDLEWCTRALAAGARVATGEHLLARFALHPGSKSQDYMHRMHAEEALMYLRFSGRPGFRRLACLASALHPAGRALAARARLARGTGRQARGFLLARAARLVRAVHRGIFALGRWSERLPDPEPSALRSRRTE